jgi:site-specific DNA-methyltransferase (adenine-specific)
MPHLAHFALDYRFVSFKHSLYEPSGIFRKPLPKGMTVGECLRVYGTGGLRRNSLDQPFTDVILSERTSRVERTIANHPSIKPQSFLRQVVRASLPLGIGTVLDPFLGSGSTIAAAEAQGYSSVGVERFAEYFDMSARTIPILSNVSLKTDVHQLALADLLD